MELEEPWLGQAAPAHITDGADLEAVGLVHEHNLGNGNKGYTSIENLVKSCAAAVGGSAHHHGCDAWRLRGGGRSRCSCVVDRHHDRRGERRSSFPSFPVIFPTMCPNGNRQPSLWAKR